ncbi:hypothetical protein [Formosa sp. S-31]|uniref:hypothetical protein n=1 Tax=Formosa sp. S-31 TaxID=2790949 RepID=UPI003EC0DC28
MNSSLRLKGIMIFLFLCCVLLLNNKVFAQESVLEQEYRKYSIIAGIQFQNFALPFKDLESNFTHPGFFIGSEISYNQKETLIQQAGLGAYANKDIGNGLFLSTQIVYRPKIYNKFYGELKAGLSYLRVFHPTQAYIYENGTWNDIVGGKSQLGIPLDFGFGYSFTSSLGELSPFMLYQIAPALFYNDTLPVNIYTSFLIGLRVKLLK